MAATFVPLSLVAVGGANAVMPEAHRQVVEVHGWLSDSEFASLFAIGQAAPGPNVLVVSLIGWRLAGWAGLVVATASMCGPTCLLAFVVGRLTAGRRGAAWPGLVRRGLVPVAVGLSLATGFVIARAADRSWPEIGLTVAVTIVVVATRLNPIWLLVAGAAVGVLAA